MVARITDKQARDIMVAVNKYGGIRPAARAVGLPWTTVQNRMETARRRFPDGAPPTKAAARAAKVAADLPAAVLAEIKRGNGNPADIARALEVPTTRVRNTIADLVDAGSALAQHGDDWRIETTPQLGSQRDKMAEIVADKDGFITIGACGDQHLCSKYERLDCLNDYYDEAERRGISLMLNTGNWIDGEARFNTHDLKVHGFDAQMKYLAAHYPQRRGIETWAITGADHEGWYARAAGIDVGRTAERTMQDAGRTDWRDMGYMEAYIRLVHPASGKSSMLCLMHPGGGSAYAISYAPQKIVEGFDGGDKPAVLLIGHYHKASYQLTRNVHAAQTGRFQDQTPFMRQRKLAAHLGGAFMRMQLDPRTGAVIGCAYEFRNYFVAGYYNGRWSQHAGAKMAPRKAA